MIQKRITVRGKDVPIVGIQGIVEGQHQFIQPVMRPGPAGLVPSQISKKNIFIKSSEFSELIEVKDISLEIPIRDKEKVVIVFVNDKPFALYLGGSINRSYKLATYNAILGIGVDLDDNKKGMIMLASQRMPHWAQLIAGILVIAPGLINVVIHYLPAALLSIATAVIIAIIGSSQDFEPIPCILFWLVATIGIFASYFESSKDKNKNIKAIYDEFENECDSIINKLRH